MVAAIRSQLVADREGFRRVPNCKSTPSLHDLHLQRHTNHDTMLTWAPAKLSTMGYSMVPYGQDVHGVMY